MELLTKPTYQDILLLQNKNTIEEISLKGFRFIKYSQIENNDVLKVNFIQEVRPSNFRIQCILSLPELVWEELKIKLFFHMSYLHFSGL